MTEVHIDRPPEWVLLTKGILAPSRWALAFPVRAEAGLCNSHTLLFCGEGSLDPGRYHGL